MTRRNLLLLLALWLLPGFSLFSTAAQPPRVRWDSFRLTNSAPANGATLLPSYRMLLSPGGGNSFGLAAWRVAGLQCDYATAGTTDGGTNTLTMVIQHLNADAGVGTECTCAMGSGSCATANTQFSCDCTEGTVQLGGDLEWYVAFPTPSGCMTNPAQMHCAADLFR